MSNRFEGDGEIIQRRSSLLLWAALAYCVWWLMVLSHAAPGALFFVFLVVMSRGVFATRREVWVGLVESDERGLVFRGSLLVPRAHIESAYVLSQDPPIVHVARRRGWPVRVRLTDDADAQALLHALGRGVEEAKASFRVSDPWAGTLPVLLGFFGLVVPTHVLVAGKPAAVFSLALSYGLWGLLASVSAALGSARLDVGRDGLLVRKRFGSWYLPYGALAGVSGNASKLVLEPRDRHALRLTVSQGSRMERVQLCEAIVRRIEEARQVFARSSAVEGAATLVAPGGRPVTKWLREVRALVKSRSYRDAVLDTDRLWRVVDDPSMVPATRAGAAMALAAIDGDARARLRVAAEACADPKLRVALSRVAEGVEEEEMEAVMVELVGAEAGR